MCSQYCIYFYGRNVSVAKVERITRKINSLGVYAEADDDAILVNGASRDDIELALNNSLATIDRKLQADIVKI